MPEKQDLVQRLRQLGAGHDEWRVQSPKDGLCVCTIRDDAFPDPEGMARRWLEEQRSADQTFGDYEVAKVHVLTLAEKAMLEAAAEIERLRGETRVRDSLLGEALAVLETLADEDTEDPEALAALIGQIKAARAPKLEAGLLQEDARG